MCTCTDMEDAVMGLRVAQCSQKPCEDSCRSVRRAEGLGTTWGNQGKGVGEGIPGRGNTAPLVNSGSRLKVGGRERNGAG